MNTDETKTLNELKDFLENINFVVEDIDERTIIILYYGNRKIDNFYNTVKTLAFDNDFTYYTPPENRLYDDIQKETHVVISEEDDISEQKVYDFLRNYSL